MKNRVLIALGVLLLSSCVSADKVEMVGVEDFYMVDETKFEVTVKLKNGNGSNLTVKRASIALMEGKTALVELMLDDKVLIPKRCERALMFPVSVRYSDPETLSQLPEKTNGGTPLVVIGKVTGQVGIFSQTRKVGPMSVEEFLALLDEENREMVKGFIY